jgi:tetratricopeptide (TPR) repeat protein
MRLLLALGLALLIGRPAQAEGEREQSRAHFVQGTKAFESGDYAQAIVEYEAAYKILPIPAILFNLGQAYRLKGDVHKAIELYERYVAIAPSGRVSDEARADIAELTQQLAVATAAAEKAAAERGAAQKAAEQRAAAERASAEAAARKQEELRRAEARAAVERPAPPPPVLVAPSPSSSSSSPSSPSRKPPWPSPSPDGARKGEPPVYRRWWLWTAAGGAAAVVLGVGLGVGLTRAPGAPPVTTSDGTLRPF